MRISQKIERIFKGNFEESGWLFWGSFFAKFNWFFKAWLEYLLAWIRGGQLYFVIFHINMCYYVIIGCNYVL